MIGGPFARQRTSEPGRGFRVTARCARAALVLLAAGATGTAAAADDLRIYGGIGLVSNYVASGVTQSAGKPAVQPYLELMKNGFYGGTFLSNVDFGDHDDWEIDLYFGYRQLLANELFLDVGYVRHFYDYSGDCCGEIKLKAAFPLAPGLGLKGYVAYNPQSGDVNRRAWLAYEINDKFAVAGSYGYNDLQSHTYWEVGGSYAFNDNLSMNLRYSGSGSGDEGLIFGLNLASNQTTLARFLLAPRR